MTSSILPPRSDLAPCSPITQASASTTLDLPEPLGPTMQVMPGSSWSVVEEAKDLNPFRVRLFRYNVRLLAVRSASIRGRIGALNEGSYAGRLPGEAGSGSSLPACPVGHVRTAAAAPGVPRPARCRRSPAPTGSSACAMWHELAPDQHHEQRRAGEGEPERRGDAPVLREHAPDRRSPTHQPAVDADHVDARRPGPGARSAPPAAARSIEVVPQMNACAPKTKKITIATARPRGQRQRQVGEGLDRSARPA